MSNFRNELTEDEKLARNIIGLENGSFVKMASDEDIEKQIDNMHRRKWNDMIEEQEAKFKKTEDTLNEVVNELSHSIDKLQIKPLGSYVIVKPYKENPFQKVRVLDSGLVLNPSWRISTKDAMTGDFEDPDQQIITGVVVETGPDCKWLKVGDTIMWDKPTALPVPFFSFGFYRVNENLALCVINDDLDKRF